MSLKANILHVPMTQAGFTYNRNYQLIPDTGLIDLSKNFNLHNLGIEKRGGTDIIETALVNSRVMGGHDFRKSNGGQEMLYAKTNGSVYTGNDSTVIKSGMGTNQFFHFNQFYDEAYISDGTTLPQKYVGGSSTGVIPPSDWPLYGYPFQIIFHPRGASFRNWAICKNGVYASEDGTGDNFADADVKFIPIYSTGGLVGAAEYGQELFVWSKTECFRITDDIIDPTYWGYQKSIWVGGVAHWRLIVQADNNVFLMSDDLNIYSLQGVFQTGDYRMASISRPAQIDRYLREKTDFTSIDNWHAAFDPKLRCIKWFLQSGGTQNNICLVQFLDREPDKAWVIHDNDSFASGYNASCSFTYRKTTSDWRIRTGDYSGNIWELEQTDRSDNGNPIHSIMKWKPWEFENVVMHKHFPKGVLRMRSDTNVNMYIYLTADGVRLPQSVAVSLSSGSTFDNAYFDTATFSDENIARVPFDIKTFGSTLQMELHHNNLNEDFFLAEVLIAYKDCGQRIFK